MGPFTSHRLIKGEEGDILILYADWTVEFGSSLGDLEKDGDKSLESKVRQYISRYLPDHKIALAYVASGSLLLAALSLDPANPLALAPKQTLKEVIKKAQKGNGGAKSGPEQEIPAMAAAKGEYRPGDSGEAVEDMQQALAFLGYSLDVNGTYDSRTKEVMLNFQKRYPDIKTDGVYNAKTRSYLEKLLYTPFRIIRDPGGTLVLVNKSNSLPYDYVPEDLVLPNVATDFKKPMRREAAAAYEALFRKAQEDGITFHAVSGYRSYDRQASLFAGTWSEEMDPIQWRARPGESEHQTGLAVDVTTDAFGNRLEQSFGDSPEGRWLAENAPAFGFIIRYPKDKEAITGYHYEPWHLRYVGKEAAKEMTERHLTLEEYLG